MSGDRPISLAVLVPVGALLGVLVVGSLSVMVGHAWRLPDWFTQAGVALGALAGMRWGVKVQPKTKPALTRPEPEHHWPSEDPRALADDTWRDAERKLRLEELRAQGHRPGRLGVVEQDGPGGLAVADQSPEGGSK